MLDMGEKEHLDGHNDSQGQESDTPSCLGCRRRKQRCSREHPTCNHCERLGVACVYDAKKNKPGMKPGAIETLNRRVDALEATVYNSDAQPIRPDDTPALFTAFNSLVQELRGLVNQKPTPTTPVQSQPDATVVQHLSPLPMTHDTTGGSAADQQTRKRKRADTLGQSSTTSAGNHISRRDSAADLPDSELLEKIICAYFKHVQPWTPILHETKLRARLSGSHHTSRVAILIHAVIVAAVRLVDDEALRNRPDYVEQLISDSRNRVLLLGMDGLSVENLQALSIIAFYDMGNGDTSKAWPIIGSLTRTVEYLQLSVDPNSKQGTPLLMPLALLPPAEDWTQEEERRRAFWNIFNLDRFCSVATGWNTSLTSHDVHRRLPADGGLWHKQQPVATPFFGIWDRSAARIGNSITFLPAHYTSHQSGKDGPRPTPTTAISGQENGAHIDMSTVGAYAYCIEATESLSRITSYFLRQEIDFTDRVQVSDWLTRFKELDLRLVHWKMFLPQKWKDSNVSQEPTRVEMDPNLTLAHITHNTSMILLHQQIAYPSPDLSRIVKMPSMHSAETCQSAAAETATITQKYLKHTSSHSLVNSQFAFCIYISARALLVHWKYYQTELASEFWIFLSSLDELSVRWAGPILRTRASTSLAGRYCAQLRSLYEKSIADAKFRVDTLGYALDAFSGSVPTEVTGQYASVGDCYTRSTHGGPTTNNTGISPYQAIGTDGLTLATGVAHRSPSGFSAFPIPVGQSPQDGLSAISAMLADQEFMQLDRIISFDESLFTTQNLHPGAQYPEEWGFG